MVKDIKINKLNRAICRKVNIYIILKGHLNSQEKTGPKSSQIVWMEIIFTLKLRDNEIIFKWENDYGHH